MLFIITNSQKKEPISFTLIVQKIQCFIVDWEKKVAAALKVTQYDPSNKGV